ncbi:MAG: DUF7482 domain-containing protein [Nitrososphaera sp.]
MISKYVFAGIGIAVGIAIGIGIGFAGFSNTSNLVKQIQEQNSKLAALESELKAANEKNAALEQQNQQGNMRSMGSDTSATVPPVRGFYKGQEILFIHTEASDPDVVSMLTMMMDSPVILVPSLKDVPESSLDEVYVFTNGVGGEGPFGFQPDVFSSVPTDSDYTPLREVNLASWKDTATARELRSVEEIIDAETKGELSISSPGVVVNMPIVKWPTGQR